LLRLRVSRGRRKRRLGFNGRSFVVVARFCIVFLLALLAEAGF
jgi:hypothetical protein